ncbi:MAG: M20/M25/M40 family metallo-hydrolase [Pseudomonadales bacterium]|jgi:acetylornithine deacetylase/succinyl-diaminopimelate desuccinylase-like protein|nr:M20/M25/M40 family metallo-hydrolase [Pseudomonadales bacterium]
MSLKSIYSNISYVCLLAAALLVAGPARGFELQPYVDDAVPNLVRYINVDTINPPGNESRGVVFLGGLLSDAGIAYESAESAPGRGNLWAKLPGVPDSNGRKLPGLVLLHHIDVVPANSAHWQVDPLSGDILNGYIYGRGAIDTKGLGMVQLQAFLALAASGQSLNRDVWYVATADEEAGGLFGAGWLVENRPEIFADVGYLLNEGGSGRRYKQGVAVMVEVTQKVPLWLRLRSTGRPGHGSAPQVATSVTRLVRGLERIRETNFPVNVVPPVAAMFEGIAPYQGESLRSQYASIAQAAKDPEFMLSLRLKNPGAHALLRNTCSITRLQGSSKINVVPAEASAELDCRLLPDQNPEEFFEQLRQIINDDAISIEKIMGFTPASSRTDTPLFKAIEKVVEARHDARVVPTVAGGFTDSHFFRDMGITSYGYSPFVFGGSEATGIHGNDERISINNVEQGVATFFQLLQDFAVRPQ